ncbi:Membrane fusion protein of RND family multidrug efflux pump [Pseudomonas amygdali pv. eriobotryae]|uniref:Membrane fusion protein of RND family multidrug efflux pump n=1 Tax=Pseudomonas amygdali pv. eriobotryae TaxID=129137 RepID=A0A0P9PP35_PSEA0|nr:efflux RND transporter periplasmic adaptor subunit [Pseudomonas amygdali]KPX19321.1 Membrane fusion protein of RND family multidrug efflux pump [Pseudomonas amygdali pv. eriobotryae]KWS80099.1 efflux transporter periplasmic adaptor subunit [Pseudomonas amygdali pv. eriobotryae]RML96108.1 Membrane fusion protein of RND family multidrug efflux pump [Pseudomonas amygdali pv. eriobotryae]RMO53589.1 Membrane fusion protein of RND family multidrug efflux pump [Pseudomonas amygdali pv. eriobotryae]
MSGLSDWRVMPAVALLAVLGLAGCEQKQQQDHAASTAPKEVEAIEVKAESFTVVDELPGRIEPVRVAQVRARVSGIVLTRNFEEGADVKAGAVLFQIDPAPFKAALSKAQGDLARTEATLFETQATVKRYESLVEIEAVSRQTFDTARSALQNAIAAKKSAQADVETARLNLGYATVKAPISGRIGRAMVTEGALVGQGETTLLATIQQLDPVYADFTQPVADALQMRAAIQEGRLPKGGEDALSLSVDGTDYKSTGTLLFTDVAVDRTTGQVSLRARFANPKGVLLPGMYVRVRTPQRVDANAILVPQRAVQRSSDGAARVMVIAQDGTVEVRPVKTGAMQDSRWQITEGLKAGEQVVVGNMTGLNSGDKVVAKSPSAQPQSKSQ